MTALPPDAGPDFLLGLVVWAIALEINQAKDQIMSTLAEAVAADTQIEADVAALEAQLTTVEAQLATLTASGLTPEQQAQVDAITTSLTNLHTSITAALPAPPAA